jgi:hypothetical protein
MSRKEFKQIEMLRKIQRALKLSTLTKSKTLYEPVEKSLIERAYTEFKSVAETDRQHGFGFGKISDRFSGFIGQQVIEACLSQSKPPILHVASKGNDPIEIRFPHDFGLETLQGKRVKVEAKTAIQPDRYLIITKSMWNNLVQKHGRPDFLVVVYLKGERIQSPFPERLEGLQKWVENYHEQYDAEIIGWLEGDKVEHLNDSEQAREGDWHPCRKAPCYWCDFKHIQPMDKFWAKFLEPVQKGLEAFTGDTNAHQ